MSFGILPIEDTKSCGVSADRPTDQKVADVPIGETISREDLISELEEWKKNPNNDDSSVDMVNHFIGIIKAQPSAEHKHCWDCKHYEPKYNVCHAPEVVKQVTSKLKNPCDSLLTDDNDNSKEQKSKLDLISRAEAIEVVMAEGRNVHASEYANAERIIHEADAVEALAMLPSADRHTDESCQDCPIYSAEEKNCPRFNKVIPQTRAEMNRPKGEWIEVFNFIHLAWECSECGAITSVKLPFCYECGADMRPEK